MTLTEREVDKLVCVLNHIVKEYGYNVNNDGFSYDDDLNIFTKDEDYEALGFENGLDFLIDIMEIKGYEETHTVNCRCSFCGKNYTFELTDKEFEMYYEYLYEGKYCIQDIFPNRTPAERELLRGRGGMCGKCWDKIFGDFEE